MTLEPLEQLRDLETILESIGEFRRGLGTSKPFRSLETIPETKDYWYDN